MTCKGATYLRPYFVRASAFADQSIAEREELSLDQFISLALASQVSVWEARANFAERAKQGDWQKAQEILAKAPHNDPEEFDTF